MGSTLAGVSGTVGGVGGTQHDESCLRKHNDPARIRLRLLKLETSSPREILQSDHQSFTSSYHSQQRRVILPKFDLQTWMMLNSSGWLTIFDSPAFPVSSTSTRDGSSSTLALTREVLSTLYSLFREKKRAMLAWQASDKRTVDWTCCAILKRYKSSEHRHWSGRWRSVLNKNSWC